MLKTIVQFDEYELSNMIMWLISCDECGMDLQDVIATNICQLEKMESKIKVNWKGEKK